MRRLTLRARLALLVIVGVFPFILFDLGSAYLGYRDARHRTERQALNLAGRVARSIEAELRARIALLEVLALSRPLAQGDLPEFRRQAGEALARQPAGTFLLLLAPDGQVLLNTALPPDAPQPSRRQTEAERRVLATGQPIVSDVYFGVVGRPVIAIVVPVRTPRGPLVMVLNPAPDAFDALIARERPGPDWTIAVIDGAGIRITRVPEAERFRAQPVPSEFLEMWRRGTVSGVTEMDTADGVPSLIAHARLPGHGWGVAAAVPLAAITGPAWREASMVLALGLGLLLLGLGLARWISLGIMRPILTLLHRAAQPDHQATAATAPLGLPEADRLAEALLAEAGRRRAAILALQDSERRLRLVVAELNHRAKNALATVQTLALQTARGEAGGDPQRFNEAFTGRLKTLARAHDLLAALSWEGAALGAVVRAGLAPWLEADTDAARPRFDLDCRCDLPLPLSAPGQVQALVMALHELATNASKHGALSVPEGRVQVRCAADPRGTEARLTWRESGGPPVPGPPVRRGFGTRLLERAVTRDLGPGAAVQVAFEPAGVAVSIRFRPRPPLASELPAVAVHGSAP